MKIGSDFNDGLNKEKSLNYITNYGGFTEVDGFNSYAERKDKNDKVAGNDVMISMPKSLLDVQILIDNLRKKQAIIVKTDNMDAKLIQRLMDFLSGAIYALGGSYERITEKIFLFTPNGISISMPSDL